MWAEGKVFKSQADAILVYNHEAARSKVNKQETTRVQPTKSSYSKSYKMKQRLVSFLYSATNTETKNQ